MNKIRRRRQIKIFKNIALRPALEVEGWVIYPALNISPNTEEGRRPGKATFLIPHPCERGRPIASLCHYTLNTQSQGSVEPEFWIASLNSVLLAMTRKAVGCIAMHQNTAGGKLCCQ